MQPPFPSPTPEWHNTTYAAITPTNPSVSVSGKSIIITGGGTGIGKEIVRAYAQAGASTISILGRTAKTLNATKAEVEAENEGVTIEVYVADVVDEAEMKKVAAKIGGWDVLVLNAAYMNDPTMFMEAGLKEWWKTFEINILGQMTTIQTLTPTRRPNSAIIGTSSGGVLFPNAMLARHTSYAVSKLAVVKFYEMVAVIFPDVHVVTVAPGVVQTEMAAKAELPDGFAFDDVLLPAHFTVWLSSPEARFLRGKFVWCNWDVEQLKAKKAEIEGNELLWTSTINGWPFQTL